MVNMDVLDFGEVIVGDTVSAGFMVTNNGTETLEITSVVASDLDGAFLSADQTGSLDQEGKALPQVTYMPTTKLDLIMVLW